jgi:hypothetical protein
MKIRPLEAQFHAYRRMVMTPLKVALCVDSHAQITPMQASQTVQFEIEFVWDM